MVTIPNQDHCVGEGSVKKIVLFDSVPNILAKLVADVWLRRIKLC